jgi:hypothetical protein
LRHRQEQLFRAELMPSEEVKSMSVIAGARSDPAVLRRAIAAGFVGTVIEWYDFIIFGTSR